ncbi:MAG: dihydrolipoyl dehydrogenase [Bacillota bacterium]|jgi:dihydrolipoamide dehydrogenase
MRDLVIIGGGPGGYVAAIRAAQLGMQVTLVEKDQLGGTCLNRGCIPTKAYYQNAALLRSLESLEQFNISTGPWQFDLPGAYRRKQETVHNLVHGVERLLQANGVQVIKGLATITSPGQVAVNGELLQTKRILIAAGSISAKLPIPGMDLPQVLNSDQILELQTVPRHLTVIGGGVIGLEFACIFHAFGSEVTVVEYQPELLSVIDKEIAKRMKAYLKRQGMNIQTGAAVKAVSQTGDGLTLTVSGPKGEFQLQTETILLATGRRACTRCVNLDDQGIAVDQRGFIVVDDDYQTSVPGIYAIGDVIGGRMLAHVASEEGRVAAERMAGLEAQVAYHAVPAVIFTFPEIATVGITEEEAKASGINYRVGKFQFAANSKAVAMGETDGLIKVIADEEGVVIGVHIIGPHASDLIQAASLMVKERMRTERVSSTIHPHPTLGEALLEAVLDVDGRAIHLVPRRR